MHMHVFLLLSAILAPIMLGLAALVASNDKVKNIVVVIAAAVTSLLGVAIAFQGTFLYSFPEFMNIFAYLFEFIFIAIFIYIAFNIKNWIITVFAFSQLVLLILDFILVKHEEINSAQFVVDPLSIILVLIVSLIGSLIIVYSIGYMQQHKSHAPKSSRPLGMFYFFLIAFLGVMNGLVVSNDLKWLSIFWEATTLCSFMLIGHEGTVEAKQSASRALQMNLLGGSMLMLGTFVAGYMGIGNSISSLLLYPALIPISFIIIAAFTKSAQMPFQSWLLGAMVAPTPVSALLHSSTMVKAGSYLVLRLVPAFAGTQIAPIIAIAGGFTFAVTSALAISQSNAKKVLAYSTIANLGLIVACAGIGTPLAYAAALTILCFHAISKALLFLCVGTIEQTIGSRNIEDMSGILFKMPLTTIIAIIGMVSMLIPPFGMLLSKWMAIETAVSLPIVLVLIIVGSAFTLFFWSKWIGRIVTASYHPIYTIEKLPRTMSTILVILVVGVILAGLASVPIYHYFIRPNVTSLFANMGFQPSYFSQLKSVDYFMTWPFFVIFGLVLLAIILTLKNINESKVRQPFLCGENLEGGETSFEFRSIGDRGEKAYMSSYYLTPIFGEKPINSWANPIAVLILLTLLGVILI